MKVNLELSNYVAKADSKMQQVLLHRILLKKTDLANFKPNVDKLDINKLKNVLSDLSNLKSKEDNLHIGKLETTPVDLII